MRIRCEVSLAHVKYIYRNLKFENNNTSHLIFSFQVTENMIGEDARGAKDAKDVKVTIELCTTGVFHACDRMFMCVNYLDGEKKSYNN
jgi:hypothetical protein